MSCSGTDTVRFEFGMASQNVSTFLVMSGRNHHHFLAINQYYGKLSKCLAQRHYTVEDSCQCKDKIKSLERPVFMLYMRGSRGGTGGPDPPPPWNLKILPKKR